ncbi:hypothetical protein K402DRAFT_60984 [Aulographum hederae CBS 113979]|uniref:Uncharacterized protein n=1 Tax=Aulographum hederae CBS 113979 TaxID=1176131 RepID=A0A6G1H1V6_9PEZI|nr:hypothetical protein K402DRAFT_60984 [Aulographum hederae CBS 113979]
MTEVLERMSEDFDGGMKTWHDADWIDMDEDEEEWKALLSTPNVAGNAWFLIQHKVALGHKVVGRLKIFADEESMAGEPPNQEIPNICMEVIDFEGETGGNRL